MKLHVTSSSIHPKHTVHHNIYWYSKFMVDSSTTFICTTQPPASVIYIHDKNHHLRCHHGKT